MDDWRSSAARAGADEALMYVLSWYEGIDLDALKTLCAGSKWTTDPDLIRRRQEMAYSLIHYALMHSFIDGKRVPQAEEIGDGDEEEEEGEEPADEMTEVGMPPSAATGATSDPSTSNPAA